MSDDHTSAVPEIITGYQIVPPTKLAEAVIFPLM